MLFILLLLLITHGSFAQQFRAYTPIESSNGLSESSVRSINQLPDGRIAVVTVGMVNLYNGTSFQYIHINDEHTYPLIGYIGFHHVYVENENHLWIKTRGKLMLINPGTERYEEHPEKVLASMGIHEPLSDFFMDAGKNLWLITVSGKLLYRASASNKTTTFLSRVMSPAGSSDPIYDVAVTDGNLHVFYRSGLVVVYDVVTKKEISRQNTLEGLTSGAYMNTLYVVQGNHTLYLLRNGKRGVMLVYNDKQRKWEKVIETDYWLNSLATGPGGEVVICCRKGLWTMDNTLKEQRFSPTLHLVDGTLINIEVSNLFFDAQGGLWLGTLNKGLLYFHPDRFRFRNIGKSLFPLQENQELYITSFAEDKAGGLLVGTDQGIFRYSDKEETLTLFAPVLKGVNCKSMLSDQQGNILVCTSEGLFIISGTKISRYAFGNLNSLLKIAEGRYYICTENNGLAEFNIYSGKLTSIPIKNADRDKLSSIRQMVWYQGSLLGISNSGLFTYNTHTNEFKLINYQQNFRMFHHNNHQYNCLLADSRGLLWFGTQDGLNVWDGRKQKLRSFHTEDGLVNNAIQSITEDDQKSIWVSTANGVSRVRVLDSIPERQFNFMNFNHYDGVINNEFAQGASYMTRNGSLLLGGIDGFNKVDLRRIFDARKNLDPIFVDFQVFGQSIKPGDFYNGNKILKRSITTSTAVILNHNQNFLTLAFSALNYINPSQSYYQYFLDGVDDNWHETATTDGIGRATYTNLAPGSYQLKVRAADNSRNWGGKTITLKITILPPWWKTTFMLALYWIAGIGFIYFTILWIVRKSKAKQLKLQQQKLDEMKFSFFTNISHELRTPLTLILSPLEVILEKVGDAPLKSQLTGIYRNAQSLLNLVNQLLKFRRLELNGEILHLNYANADLLTANLCRPFQEIAPGRGISFQRICPQELWLFLDQEKFGMILNNLLSNAFKFTPDGGAITLTIENTLLPDRLTPAISVSVADTGSGIPEVDLPKVFNRFFQGGNQGATNTGSGIGLHLVQEYVQLHHGTIDVKSEPGKGSVFTFSIPLNLEPLLSETIKQEPDISRTTGRISILIAEDNDEFRKFLEEQLIQLYDVILAADGKEAHDLVLKQSPDLIISDIMMPGMSGIGLCSSLKKDIRTSHIPVILLTALTSDESQYEGYQVRADAYVTKPFNINILTVRIRNLIEQQEQRKQLFKTAIVIQPSMVTASEIDQKLIKRALDCVEKKLSDSTYSVEEFSSDMNMERSGLYRKLVSITGQTPSVFIRSVRLKKAAQLLALREISVAEIADRVGFSNPAYFSKCFQEEFDVKPSHYADHHAASNEASQIN